MPERDIELFIRDYVNDIKAAAPRYLPVPGCPYPPVSSAGKSLSVISLMNWGWI